METEQHASLERKLYLQKLKTNRLVELTQAINNNVKTPGLLAIYRDLLTWVLGVDYFVLLISEEGEQPWSAAVHQGLSVEPSEAWAADLGSEVQIHKRNTLLDVNSKPAKQGFRFLVPIYHKEKPLALLLLGGKFLEAQDEELYEALQYISAVTNVVLVAIENKRLFKRQLEQERMKKELELAKQVQQMLIPSSLPHAKYYEFAGVYQPHEGGVGGDYYDFIELEQGEVVFCIADISGKGTPAALLMANFQANLHALVRQRDLPISELVEQLNQMVLKITRGDRFITLFLARFCPKTRQLNYLCAGHNPPFVYTASQGLQRLDKGCTLLGVFSKLPHVEHGTVQLSEPAFLCLYTDGLSEARNAQGQEFGPEMLEAFCLTHQDLSPEAFNQALLQAVQDFKGDVPFSDDVSLLSGRLLPQA